MESNSIIGAVFDTAEEEANALFNEHIMTERALQDTAMHIKNEMQAWMGEDITETINGRCTVRQIQQNIDVNNEPAKAEPKKGRIRKIWDIIRHG